MGRLRVYQTNQDDAYTDPALIGVKYQVGNNAFFEVELVTSEIEGQTGAMNNRSTAVGSGTTVIIIPDGGGGEGGGPGCPEENQFVWVEKQGVYSPVKAKELIDSNFRVYNPVTRNFNEIEKAILREDVPLIEFITTRGATSKTSDTHFSIHQPGDLHGEVISDYKLNTEILSFAGVNIDKVLLSGNIYTDDIKEMRKAGRGKVVEIHLKTEYIYATGSNMYMGTVAHNRKSIF